jgi:hypothetical protein
MDETLRAVAAMNPTSDSAGTRIPLIPAAALMAAALAVVIAAAVLVGGRGRDGFDRGSVDDLLTAFSTGGLAICSSTGPQKARDDGGPLSTEQVLVALPGGCGDPVTVQVDAYSDAAHRDAAARAVEGSTVPRTFGTVFTWHQFTIYLQADDASADSAVVDRIVSAADSVGAR